ncbi:MAG: DNA alkylation repair protein [Acidobacteriota bacterium]
MNTKEILTELEGMADERTLSSWSKMGMDTSNYFGVALGAVKKYAKTLGKDHELALALWETGNHDARLLATFVEVAKAMDAEQADRWVGEAGFWDLSDKVCSVLVAKTKFAGEKVAPWIASDGEFTRRSGWVLLGELGKSGKGVSDEELFSYIEQIEREVHQAPNWTKDAMNVALWGIGSRSKAVNEAAVEAARRIGAVDVDYGETTCKVPDVLALLTHERLQKKLK